MFFAKHCERLHVICFLPKYNIRYFSLKKPDLLAQGWPYCGLRRTDNRIIQESFVSRSDQKPCQLSGHLGWNCLLCRTMAYDIAIATLAAATATALVPVAAVLHCISRIGTCCIWIHFTMSIFFYFCEYLNYVLFLSKTEKVGLSHHRTPLQSMSESQITDHTLFYYFGRDRAATGGRANKDGFRTSTNVNPNTNTNTDTNTDTNTNTNSNSNTSTSKKIVQCHGNVVAYARETTALLCSSAYCRRWLCGDQHHTLAILIVGWTHVDNEMTRCHGEHGRSNSATGPKCLCSDASTLVHFVTASCARTHDANVKFRRKKEHWKSRNLVPNFMAFNQFCHPNCDKSNRKNIASNRSARWPWTNTFNGTTTKITITFGLVEIGPKILYVAPSAHFWNQTWFSRVMRS